MVHSFHSFCFFLIVSLLSLGPDSLRANTIEILNHQPNSIVRYPVVLLRGTVPTSASKLEIKNLKAPDNSEPIHPAISNGYFKALVPLSPGKNVIQITHSAISETISFPITFERQTNPYYVRLIWLTDSSGETEFAAPNKKTIQDYENRLRTAALLMQTFTAERMHDLGFVRKTFRLETDDQGKVIIHTFKGPHTIEQYHQMPDNQLYGSIFHWLNKNHPDPYAKNIVLMAFTRKDPETGKMKAHTALGGGNLGLFGSASIFSWPRDISKAVKVFEDGTRIDPKNVHDDSAFRNTVWGLASTTIGATLHEMGHTFGLPHCKDPLGIMTRGFDQFNRVFTLHEPISGRNRQPIYFHEKQEAYFAPISAAYLQWSPWFQLDPSKHKNQKPPVISFHKEIREIKVASGSPIRWIGYWTNSEVTKYEEFSVTEPQTEISLKMDNVNIILNGKKLTRVSAMCENGKSQVLRIPD